MFAQGWGKKRSLTKICSSQVSRYFIQIGHWLQTIKIIIYKTKSKFGVSLFGPAIFNEGGHLLVLFMSWVRVPALPAQLLQSCPALCDSIDCSLPGSYIHGIFQTIILEWVTISFSRRSFQDLGIEPWSPALQVDSLLLSHQGSPMVSVVLCIKPFLGMLGRFTTCQQFPGAFR